MPQDLPTAGELVEAVREFLETEVAPGLDGRIKYHARVAVNVLKIVQRELELAPQVDAGERRRLLSLLNMAPDSQASLQDLNRTLAERIRQGEFAERTEQLVEHLREAVRDKLRIANPGYLDDQPTRGRP